MKELVLECAIKNGHTLKIPVFEKEGKYFTNDPRSIHMLRMSLIVKKPANTRGMSSLHDSMVDLGIGEFQSPAKEEIELPPFMFNKIECAYVSPQAVTEYGKEEVLYDLGVEVFMPFH